MFAIWRVAVNGNAAVSTRVGLGVAPRGFFCEPELPRIAKAAFREAAERRHDAVDRVYGTRQSRPRAHDRDVVETVLARALDVLSRALGQLTPRDRDGEVSSTRSRASRLAVQ